MCRRRYGIRIPEKAWMLFERRKNIGLREGRFSYRAIGGRVQRNSSAVMQVWKKWTDENRTTRKTGSGRRKAVGSTWVGCFRCTNVGFVNVCCTVDCTQRCLYTGSPSRQTIDGCICNGLMSTEPHKLIDQVVLSDESRFNLWDHDGHIRVRRYASERCLPEFVIERHIGLTPGFMVWGAILYYGRSNLLRIEGNLNINRYVREVLQPEVVPFLQGLPRDIFQQDNARPHVTKTVRDFCSTQHMQLLPWPAYSPNMSPIEHVWDLVDWRLARDSRLAASEDELFQAIWNSLPQVDIQNLFDFMPRCIAAVIAARGGYTKY
ncbi:transposable element Tc1 transposase [Trichonephila clavipes]|nr:transposable element Tc1 transposase [Trichonephila clavipes]